jgi:glycosyltransferase involved in cell wall biosynthesis
VAAARAAFGLRAEDAGRRVVLVAARLTTLKGHAVLVEAAARSGPRGDLVLVFAGAGPLAAALAARAAAAGVALRLAGPLADMPAAFLAADILAAPSIAPETFGRSVAEAMAMGRVVLASDLGGQAETVEDGVSGRLVRAGDVGAWAAALEAALAMDEAERAAMSAAARARIVERHSLEAMCAATFALYRRLVASLPPAPGGSTREAGVGGPGSGSGLSGNTPLPWLRQDFPPEAGGRGGSAPW